MKILFDCFGTPKVSRELTATPNSRYATNPETQIRECVYAYFSFMGTLPITEETPLTGIIEWMSDDDMFLGDFIVDSFLRYEYNENTEQGTATLMLTNDPVPEPVPEPEPPSAEEILAAAKAGKDSAIISTKAQVIEAGFDVETEYGIEHFTLSTADQTMLLGIYAMVQGGLEQFPYHSVNTSSRSLNKCTVYSDSDIAKIATTAFGYITYHESYANMLLQWLDRETDPEVVATIVYGAQLPTDLADYLSMVLTAAGVDPSLFITPGDDSSESEASGETDTSTTEGTDGTEATTEPDTGTETEESTTEDTSSEPEVAAEDETEATGDGSEPVT